MKKWIVVLLSAFLLTMPVCAETQADTVDEEQTKEIPVAYMEILDRYHRAFDETWEREKLIDEGLNYMVYDLYTAESGNLGFALLDMDGNGISQLLIAPVTDIPFFDNMVFDFYTINEDEEAEQLFFSWERNRYYGAGENRFANIGSNSAWDSFETTWAYEKGKMVDLKTVTPEDSYTLPDLTLLIER